MNTIPPQYDVWDGVVIFNYRGLYLVDTTSRTEIDVEGPSPEGVDGFDASRAAVTDRGVAFTGSHGWSAPEGRWKEGCYLVWWDRGSGVKRLLYSASCPTGDQTGKYEVPDAWGTTLLIERQERPSSGAYNYLTMDTETMETTPITEAPGGGGYWYLAQMWGDRAVLSVGGHTLLLADLTADTFHVMDLGPKDEWRPTIHGRRVCSLDLRDGTGWSDWAHDGEEVWCIDLDAGTQWKASDTPAAIKNWPSVFGDWVAWEHAVETSPGEWSGTIGVYHRGLDRRWTLDERGASWILSMRAVRAPRVWGDHVYFLVMNGRTSDDRWMTNVYRCDLRVLFPEAYGG